MAANDPVEVAEVANGSNGFVVGERCEVGGAEGWLAKGEVGEPNDGNVCNDAEGAAGGAAGNKDCETEGGCGGADSKAGGVKAKGDSAAACGTEGAKAEVGAAGCGLGAKAFNDAPNFGTNGDVACAGGSATGVAAGVANTESGFCGACCGATGCCIAGAANVAGGAVSMRLP